jgi:tetratricopeptide (TPR) repeat protein
MERMAGRKRSSRAGSDPYTEGLLAYSSGWHAEAVAALEPLRRRGDLLGRMANYYQAMARRALGIEALRGRRFDEAEDHLRQAARALGDNADLAAYLATVYAGQGRHDLSAAQMERAAACEPDSASARRKLAQSQWRAGRRAEAHMTLTEALRHLGDRVELHLQMGVFLAAEERFAEARDALARAVAADCTCAEAHRYLGLAAAAEGDPADAARAFQRALELRPADLAVVGELVLAARAADELGHRVVLHVPEAEAPPAEESQIGELAAYVTREGDFLDACLALPESPADPDLFDLLLGVVRTALSAHPAYADLHHRASRILDRLGRVEEAVERAEEAVRINPRYVEALLHLARLYGRTNRPARGAQQVRRAIAAGADWPDAHLLAGELLGACSLRREARRHLERALELNGGYSSAAEALASLAA